ncbi:Qat anti-phage system QueC-like protein QatC [Caulobacter segnis]
MRLICAPPKITPVNDPPALRVMLYGQAGSPERASAGEAARREIARQKLIPTARAWDFLSIALAVVTADFGVRRDPSPDGWTREIELDIAVQDPGFWSTQAEPLAGTLGFLTTDRWRLRFLPGGMRYTPPSGAKRPASDSVMLLSGGLDSLVGGIDLAAAGRRPFAVSQTVRGDAEKQVDFAAIIGGGLRHIQLNHNVQVPGAPEDSQRGRSLVFIAFGVAIATALAAYARGESVPLFVCENGFIAMNAPLTGIRLGSLSTRTAHPEYLGRLQQILNAADLRVQLFNPYATLTKGEMLANCADQNLLGHLAAVSTSCGRFQRFNYHHCGRCVPCQVRRAAFLRWGRADATSYVFDPLGKDDADHARFDDVRAVAMANAQVRSEGFDRWLGAALASDYVDRGPTKLMLQRGLAELDLLHRTFGVT